MKKSVLATLIAIGGLSTLSAAEIAKWSDSDVASYKAGTIVSDSGKTYKCKALPEGGWCTLPAYKPSGIYGVYAWDSESVNPDEPSVDPVDPVNPDKPSDDPSQPDEPSEDPTDANAWNESTIYHKGDTVVYNGNKYIAQWYTHGETPNPNVQNKWDNVWEYQGEAKEKASIDFNLDANLSELGVDSVSVNIDGENHSLSAGANNIKLAEGSHTIKVDNIINLSNKTEYAAKVMVDGVASNTLNVSESEQHSVSISFEKQEISYTNVNLTVNYASGTSVSRLQAHIKNSDGYDEIVSVSAGSNSIQLPSNGDFTITFDSYEYQGEKYIAPAVTVKDGVANTHEVTFKQDSIVLAGYLPVSWGSNPPTISKAADMGYNIVLAAFVEIKSGQPIKFTDNVFIPYGGWNDTADSPKVVEDIKNDIEYAKANGLKYALASIGGEHNTFDPGANADYDALADKTIAFLDKYGFDGIDFDLEVVPSSVTGESVKSFIEALKAKDPDIIITSAPQVNEVGGKLDYVNTGEQQVYNDALKAGLFDYMFVQAYNTGNNYVDQQGNKCAAGSANCYDQLSARFIENSFYALQKLTPANTKIVIGQPATKASAGAATVFNGQDSSRPYNAMCESYQDLNGQTQYGGSMTWEITHDSNNNYQFANMVNVAFNNEDCGNL